MKKRRMIALLCAPLLLCGCDTGKLFGQKTPEFDTAYSINADISYGDYNASAEITRSSKNNWEFSFTEPSVLMGMKLTLSEDGMTAHLGDLNINTENSSVYQMVPDIISACIDSLPDINAENITENDGTLTLSTELSGSKVVITADKNGDLISLKCPKHRLSVKFSDQIPITTTETIESVEIIIEE